MNTKKYVLLTLTWGMLISFQAAGETPGSVMQQDGKVVDNYSNAREVLEQFVKSRENTKSYIAKANEECIYTYPGFNGVGRSYTNIELRTDGDRCRTIISTWGDINARFRNAKEQQADYYSTLWDGERAFSVGKSVLSGNGRKQALITNKSDPGDEEKKVSVDYKASCFEEANGYHRGDLTRLDKLFLKPTTELKLQDKKSNLRGADCYVIEADVPERGKYTVWFDPVHDFNIARIQVQREAGDIIGRRPLDHNYTTNELYEVLEFEKVGEAWCPKICKIANKTESPDYQSSYERKITYSMIMLNPDHDALGSFLPDDIPDGATVLLRAFPPDIEFTWQDGKVVDKAGKVVMTCNEPNEAAGEKEAEIQAGGSNSQVPQVSLECRILSIFDKKGVETFLQKKVVIEGNSSAYIITEQDVEDLFQLTQRHKKSKSLECPHVIIFSGKEGNIRFVSENNIGFSLQAIPAVNRENRYVDLAVQASEILPAGSPVQTIKIPATVESGQTLLVMAPPGFLREFLQEKDSRDSTVLLLIKPSILLPDTPVSLSGKKLPEMAALHLPVDPNAMKDQPVLLCFCDLNQRPSRHYVEELVKKAEELKGKGVVVALVQTIHIDKKDLDEWITKYEIPFPVGMIMEDLEKVLLNWGVRGQPWLILTDQKHIVRAEGFGIDKLGDKLGKLVEE